MENIEELYYMYRMKDTYAHERLLKILGNTLKVYVMNLYDRKGIPNRDWEDVYETGLIGIQDALDTYRADRGSSVYTYTVLVGKRLIHNHIRSMYAYKRTGDRYCASLDYLIEEKYPIYGLPKAQGLGCPEFYVSYNQNYSILNKKLEKYTQIQRDILSSWIADEKAEKGSKRLGISKRYYESALRKMRIELKNTIYSQED